ncbi:hypothetical protein MLD38_036932 [Melastoma candidum]|uniref:Uncharacterized protein n=1 Tax=Melastoma candidum TaxID=119954 RepID=A0ACB9LN18_9MYRT|nr:hypothetical protein MLD38_036932 [Melastoma candidum]
MALHRTPFRTQGSHPSPADHFPSKVFGICCCLSRDVVDSGCPEEEEVGSHFLLARRRPYHPPLFFLLVARRPSRHVVLFLLFVALFLLYLVIEVGICMGFLKRTLLESWERLRCEAAFAEPQKYYCPFKDCSGMLIVDGEAGDPVRLRECECPYCHRLFCASCRVPWHWKYTCEEFKSTNAKDRGSNDVLLKELAQKRKWQRCPTCKFYVERTFGCPHIVCRCPTLLPTHLSYGSGCWKLRVPIHACLRVSK